MSGYVRVPTSDQGLTHRDESDVDDGSERDTSGEDCATFADNEDNQGSPLIGRVYIFEVCKM